MTRVITAGSRSRSRTSVQCSKGTCPTAERTGSRYHKAPLLRRSACDVLANGVSLPLARPVYALIRQSSGQTPRRERRGFRLRVGLPTHKVRTSVGVSANISAPTHRPLFPTSTVETAEVQLDRSGMDFPFDSSGVTRLRPSRMTAVASGYSPSLSGKVLTLVASESRCRDTPPRWRGECSAILHSPLLPDRLCIGCLPGITAVNSRSGVGPASRVRVREERSELPRRPGGVGPIPTGPPSIVRQHESTH